MNKSRTPEEILRDVEQYHEQYVKNLRFYHEAIVRGVASSSTPNITSSPRMERSGSSDSSAPSPAIKAIGFSSHDGRPMPTMTSSDPLQSTSTGRSRRLTNELQDPRRMILSSAVHEKRIPTSLYSDSEDENDDFLPLTSSPSYTRPATTASGTSETRSSSRILEALPTETYSDDDLAAHLASLDETKEATAIALGDVWLNRKEIDGANVISSFPTDEEGPYSNATYEVYEVGKDDVAKAVHDDNGDQEGETLEGAVVWDTIKTVNKDGKAVGRMTILQEASPLMLGAAHLTMSRHFDMDELFQHLVSNDGNKGKTKAYMNRAYESDPLRRRTFFFVFKYYTVVCDGVTTPAPWQAYDSRPPDRRSPDHIDISECSSVLALSLGGESTRTVKSRVRRKRGATQQGLLYDTFAPWHLLSVQCFPDNAHSMRSEDSKKPFYNGPYAFLDSLSLEYRDAVKRYTQLNEMITKLITPPNQFMFDSRLRDKLLFEDKDFTYSRRYFWAYNTLGVINDGIKSMRSAYIDTFTKDFWAGRHPTLWPHPCPDTAEGRLYNDRMEVVRHELESAVGDLAEMYEKNEKTRTEIRSLREQLFSGSSVKESRRAIEQGDNIKILTGVSMIFLPLTFVTSVFGITTFNISAEDWRFPVTMVSVCIPFFLLILILQTRAGMDAIKRCGRFIDDSVYRVFGSLEGDGKGKKKVKRGIAGGGGGGGDGAGAGGSGGNSRGPLKRAQSGISFSATGQKKKKENRIGVWWRTWWSESRVWEGIKGGIKGVKEMEGKWEWEWKWLSRRRRRRDSRDNREGAVRSAEKEDSNV
ncbi:hypothetical protein QBC46DRAFT_83929 [Diplogelasinospora grovesii]|uniref:Uncharacterized protein n=1 Tax=Diplogelasinospora grovesii TaxID=303347 RepID=A0AAN6NA44_9PEZI|nr:hypothetical protein QBC46DRAFT_83929 [Diplogelasinospora grovesii]